MFFLDVTKKKRRNVLLRQPIKTYGLLRQPIACYKIAKRTHDFVNTYVGNRTINMTLVMLFLVGNIYIYSIQVTAAYLVSMAAVLMMRAVVAFVLMSGRDIFVVKFAF